MTAEAGSDGDVVDAAVRLLAERGWRATTLSDIAAAAGIPPEEMRVRYRCKSSVLSAMADRIENAAAAEAPGFDDEDTVRDRLFELLMQRIDLMADWKGGVANILRDLPADPISAAMAAPSALRHLGGVLEQAGVSASGPVGRLRCKGLGAIWLATLTEWVRDDSPDHARTMASLDAALRRAEPFARLLSPQIATRGGSNPAAGAQGMDR